MADTAFTPTAPSTATAIGAATSAPALAPESYEDGEDTFDGSMYSELNKTEIDRDSDQVVYVACVKGKGRDSGKALFRVLLGPKDRPLTETEQRLFNAIKANFYRGRTPKVARMRSAPQDETAF